LRRAIEIGRGGLVRRERGELGEVEEEVREGEG
jgi:hypothetical protein